MHGNISFAAGALDKAQTLFTEVVDSAGITQGDAADFAAIAKLKLAEIKFPEHSADAQ